MAIGRTISADKLTILDEKVLKLCKQISDLIFQNIEDTTLARDFMKVWGKINLSRDAGIGVGAGKLQRDALCTRGKQGKAPYSNRNLRWHPLVVAANPIDDGSSIETIDIISEDGNKKLIFYTTENAFKSDHVHELKNRYVITPEHWEPHINELKDWKDDDWTRNSCVIPAYEASNWSDCVEVFAVLGLSVGVAIYGCDFENIFSSITDILRNQDIDDQLILPTCNFPESKEDIINCPMCKNSIAENILGSQATERSKVWEPGWRSKKRSEGDDSAIQMLHTKPLKEEVFNHIASNVRYGHRWCNIAMTDHDLESTLNFMKKIVESH